MNFNSLLKLSPVLGLSSAMAQPVTDVIVGTSPTSLNSVFVDGHLVQLESAGNSFYLAGILAGILLPLLINIWYSLTYKRDAVSLVYALWVVIGLLQILSMPLLGGQRILDSFWHEHLPNIGLMPTGVFITALLTYCQTSLFIQFGRSFLGTRENFPRLHLISTVYITFEACRLMLEVILGSQSFNGWLQTASVGLGAFCYAGYPTCALIRYRQGLRSAQFAFLSSSLYGVFWLAGVFLAMGYSVFALWPLTGVSPVFKNVEILQACAICCAAIITNFSIQSRARGIERKLRQTMQTQKEAVENQNLVLESTVNERTRELDAQRQVFEVLSHQLAKYLPPQIHQALMAGRYDTRVSTQRKKLTVFFSDIKDFTTTSESLQPEALTEYLNEYFSEMTQIAIEHGATIDKYIGDAMMVFFGDPETRGVREDARACVEMALKMQERMAVLQQRWKAKGFENPFVIRIGINTGYCNVGNFGSDQRLSYTIIGREVNVAQRLESQAEAGGILLSYETYAHVQDMVAVEERQSIRLKGIAQEVKAFAVKSRLLPVAEDVISLHEPVGVSIDLRPDRLDAESRTQLALNLRQMATRLEEGGQANWSPS
jgi:class 3 adenylate cyclase